tara:strand:- start:57699 stop:59195 length:1497 start_codon:yes stop_codon:yes gene_type:complete
MDKRDVIVLGAGNAGLCAAISAAECGARVLLLEKAPAEHTGGNSAHTGGAFRVAYKDVQDLQTLMPDLSPAEVEVSDFGSYPADQFFDDLAALSQYRADADVLYKVTYDSLATLQWMVTQGVRFLPIYGRQAVKTDGRFRFWGGLTIEASGGGLGLVQSLCSRAEALGVDIRHESGAVDLFRGSDGGWTVICCDGKRFSSSSVVIATGGFHANLRWRAQYLGPGWDLAKVRGCRYNTGDGIHLALEAGAAAHGNWSGCHAVFYDLNAPMEGDLSLLNMQKNYFHLGVVVNSNGERFVDEGANFRNYTYSTMGREVLRQPGAVAWQVFDQQTIHLLPDEYRTRGASRIEAGSLEELAEKLEGINTLGFLEEIRRYNAAVDTRVAFDPTVLDGRCTRGLAIPKSNWAMVLQEPPFVAYAVTCGITFTYGGLRVDEQACVLDEGGCALPGLYAAGELVGNLYYVKYAGGAGLTSGSVLGRVAGRNAALAAAQPASLSGDWT